MPGPRKQSFAKPKNAKGTFRRILTYFRPYRLQLVLVLIGLLVSACRKHCPAHICWRL